MLMILGWDHDSIFLTHRKYLGTSCSVDVTISLFHRCHVVLSVGLQKPPFSGTGKQNYGANRHIRRARQGKSIPLASMRKYRARWGIGPFSALKRSLRSRHVLGSCV